MNEKTPDSFITQKHPLYLFHEYRGLQIKALSWKQPYGLLMLPPHNKIETRTWRTSYKGLVLICASQKEYSPNEVEAISGETQFARIEKLLFANKPVMTQKEITKEYFHNGHAIAIGRLDYIRRMVQTDEAQTFVECPVDSDLFCHFYKNVRAIVPFPFRGSQSFRNLTQEELKQIKLL